MYELTKLDILFPRDQLDDVENYKWMKTRIQETWEKWVEAYKLQSKKTDLNLTKKKKVRLSVLEKKNVMKTSS